MLTDTSSQARSNQCDRMINAMPCEGRRWVTMTVNWFQPFGFMSVVPEEDHNTVGLLQPAGGPLIAAQRARRRSTSLLLLAICL